MNFKMFLPIARKEMEHMTDEEFIDALILVLGELKQEFNKRKLIEKTDLLKPLDEFLERIIDEEADTNA
ncbi:MAG: hypothetical protein LBU81_02810 [Methanosarcinales archaeon]|jgi:hypothetical protein|nr:hypothetical protein [Methanosarcinales archaeon]